MGRVMVVLGAAAMLCGFTEPRTYYETAASGGGGGRFFTGSPAEGYGCSACHTGPAKQWPLQVTGLPASGYVPGQSYELRVRFREFAAHVETLRDERVPPSMGLVAELVAESGIGAGTLELSQAGDADERELCVVPEGQLASQLYAVTPGAATHEEPLKCEAKTLGQRCIVATRSCGASELRVKWTAPAQWQGPIWFAAGFVTTERVSGDPTKDSVTEIKEVLLPAATMQKYSESVLRSGCSTVRASSAGGAAMPLVACAMLVCIALVRRARLRVRARGAWLIAATGALLACREAPEPSYVAGDYDDFPKAGLFTPGSTLGALPSTVVVNADGSVSMVDPNQMMIEDAINMASGEERCVDLAGEPGAAGSLSITFGTATYDGFYTPENCGAVWIEDPDGKYVATPAIWAELRTRNLFIWTARRCAADVPDAITSATLEDHSMLHEVTWDGKDRDGKIVPNGMYVLNIEVTEDEFNYGRRTEVPFEWGGAAFIKQPTQDEQGESVHDLVMTYTPPE